MPAHWAGLLDDYMSIDAALWIVTAPVTGNTILMVIYTDDCDCVGPEVTELEQIKEAFHDRLRLTVITHLSNCDQFTFCKS
jgi:hypothetical protein